MELPRKDLESSCCLASCQVLSKVTETMSSPPSWFADFEATILEVLNDLVEYQTSQFETKPAVMYEVLNEMKQQA